MKKYLPFFVLFSLSIAFYLSPLRAYCSWDLIQSKLSWLKMRAEHHPIETPLLFTLSYFILVSLSFPAVFILSLLSGFLFSEPFSLLYVAIGATLGASVIFLAARGPFHNFMEKRTGRFARRFKEGFEKNGLSYLLFLRIVPIFPFWVVNLIPAFFPIPLWRFVWTTFLGILPGAFIYTLLGEGLSQELRHPSELFSSWKLKIGLIGLVFSALLPLLFKKKARN